MDLDGLFAGLFRAQEEAAPRQPAELPEEGKPWFPNAPEEPEEEPEEEPVSEGPSAPPEELPLVYEVTLEQLLAMTD